MPELPEVETIRKGLNRLIVGKKILGFETDSPKQVQPSLAVVKKGIIGERVTKVKRRAKLLQIYLSNNQALVIHLKLTGRLLVRKKGTPKDDWQHVVIKLRNRKTKKLKNEELELRFCDLRKFGWIKLVKDEKQLEKLLSEFGPEPLKSLDLATFKKVLAKTSQPVKVLLMDQRKISGVGNIYASEALFLARIDPRRPANKIEDKEAGRLFKAIEEVLKIGIRYRGVSDQYYLDALGRKSTYQKHFLVYGREGKRCFDCKGIIKKIKLGGRGTYFCPKCQR